MNLKMHKCDILFTADASTVCNFKPQVVLSQDLLSYEKDILKKYKISWNKIRIIIIRYLQNISFRRSAGTIFLNNYSKTLIENSCGELKDTRIIPHGVNPVFFNLTKVENIKNNTFNLIYISNAEIYKNHYNVLKSFKILLDRGFNVHLTFVGGGDKNILKDLDKFIYSNNIPSNAFKQFDFLSLEQVLFHLSESDIFIYASSCESFGITLLEGMATGLPIACSNKSSLPELLLDGGAYFDPNCPYSISDSIEILISDKSLREEYSKKANTISQAYSWQRTSKETFNYIFNKTQ
jgi:glycosyltransferase involved in cell wall biosynthesis